MDGTLLAHVGIALLNLLTALVSWLGGRKRERSVLMSKDRRSTPRP